MRTATRLALAAILLAAGLLHLVRPGLFDAVVPDFLPAPRAIILASGVLELALGAALATATANRGRERMGWIVALFFVAVFPGNLWQAYEHVRDAGIDPLDPELLRLPLQPVLVVAAVWSTRPGPPVVEAETKSQA